MRRLMYIDRRMSGFICLLQDSSITKLHNINIFNKDDCPIMNLCSMYNNCYNIVYSLYLLSSNVHVVTEVSFSMYTTQCYTDSVTCYYGQSIITHNIQTYYSNRHSDRVYRIKWWKMRYLNATKIELSNFKSSNFLPKYLFSKSGVLQRCDKIQRCRRRNSPNYSGS